MAVIVHVALKPSKARLTKPQLNAIAVLKECADYADGWGVLVTNHGSRMEDGQAWIYYWSGLRLVAKSYAEYDEQFGRIRLLDRRA